MQGRQLFDFSLCLFIWRRAEGFSLAEVLVAMMVLSFGALAALSGFRWTQEALGDGQQATRALALAESRLEAKLSTSWRDLLLDDTNADGVHDFRMRDDGGGQDEHAGDGRYTGSRSRDGIQIRWTVQPDRPDPLWLVGSALIRVHARYQTASGHWRQIQLETLRANPNYVGPRQR